MTKDIEMSRRELMHHCFMVGYRFQKEKVPTLSSIDMQLKVAGLGEYLSATQGFKELTEAETKKRISAISRHIS